MTEYKNIIIVETNEAGQPTNLRRLEDGDTISNERLNDDIRNAGTNATTALNTANTALAKTEDVSGTVYDNSGSWGVGGIDPNDLANLKDVSNAFTNFEDNVSGTLAGKDSIDSTSLLLNTVVKTSYESNADTNAFTDARRDKLNGIDANAQVNFVDSNAEVKTAYEANADTNAFTDARRDKLNGIDANAQVNFVDSNADVKTAYEANADTNAFTDAKDSKLTGIESGATNNQGALADKNTIDATNLIDDDIISLDKLKHIQVQRILGTTAGGGGVITQLTAGDARTTMGLGDLAVRDDANKLYVNNTSSVAFSGTDSGDAQSVPEDAAMLVIDTAAERIKFKNKINGTRIEDQSITTDQISNTAGITAGQLATGAALGNLATNSVGFIKLPLISARTLVGNANETTGSTMDDLSRDDARNLLGLSAGTVAPTYTSLNPSAGDLWYNTDDDELYTYDSGRGHWLGAPHYISMGKTTTTTAGTGHYLYVGHNGTTATTAERGWLVPHDMVITGWRGHTQSTFTDWTFRIDKNSGGTNTTGIVSTGALGAVDTFSDFTLDVDVAAGDILGVAGVTGTVALNNSTVIIKVQRKGA